MISEKGFRRCCRAVAIGTIGVVDRTAATGVDDHPRGRLGFRHIDVEDADSAAFFTNLRGYTSTEAGRAACRQKLPSFQPVHDLGPFCSSSSRCGSGCMASCYASCRKGPGEMVAVSFQDDASLAGRACRV